MEAYLDNSATTRCSDRACQMMVDLLTKDYGNPSSLHMKGIEAERFVETAKKKIAKTLRVSEKEIIFTSGGTESNNLAIIGAAMANRRAGNHIITTSIEHASVENPMEFLREQGFDITYLSVDENGIISMEELEEAVTEQTILVSMMQVNNEIGAIEPVAEAAALIKKKNPNTLIHVDAIQSYGKMYIYPKKLGIDMLSVSGHKIHGPKGSGFLFINDKTRIKPIIYGGGQQKGMRSGTDNVPGWAGMAKAAQLEFENFDDKVAGLYDLREYFIDQVLQIKGTAVNGGLRPGSFTVQEDPLACAAPHIVSVSFDDVRAEVLLHAMAEKGVSISAGSACSSNHPDISRTLKAIGVPKEHLDSTVRFSFSFDSDREQVDYCINALKEVLPVLRRYVPGGRKKRR